MTNLKWARAAVFTGFLASAVVGVVLASGRQPSPAPKEAAWTTSVQQVASAVAQGDVSLAIYRWRDAYGEASRSRHWTALLAVGDAALLIDQAPRNADGFKHEARRAYLEALFRARSLGSDEGIRRAADAFEALGDATTAQQARSMASSSPTVQAER